MKKNKRVILKKEDSSIFKLREPGEMLRFIRKKYRLNQEDLIRERNLTREAVSHIENGKVNLTRENADMFIENMKIRTQELGHSDFDYTVEDLFNKDFQKKREVENIISDLSISNVNEKVKEINKFFSSYTLLKESINCSIAIGNIYRDAENASRAYEYYKRAFYLSTNYNYFRSDEIMLKICETGFELDYYKSLIEMINMYFEMLDKFSEKDIQVSFYLLQSYLNLDIKRKAIEIYNKFSDSFKILDKKDFDKIEIEMIKIIDKSKNKKQKELKLS